MWDDFRESQRHEMLDILTRSSLSISAIAKAQLFQSWDFALDEYIKKYNIIISEPSTFKPGFSLSNYTDKKLVQPKQ